MEKTLDEKVDYAKQSSMQWFSEFSFVFGRSKEENYSENLTPYFATLQTCGEYVNEVYSRFEDRSPEKWNQIIFDKDKAHFNVLIQKAEARVLRPDDILTDQLAGKGQIVEIIKKNIGLALC